MAQPAAKSKNNRAKKGRPVATSSLAQQPAASSLVAFSAFSPSGNLFALLSLAVDKHRLRVYDATNGKSVAEYTVESSRVASLRWVELATDAPNTVQVDTPPPTKRKKQSSKKTATSEEASSPTQIPKVSTVLTVALGLENGNIVFFSPTSGQVTRRLSSTNSTSAILGITVEDGSLKSKSASLQAVGQVVWTSGADGAIRAWNPHTNEILKSWKTDDRVPYSALASRPGVLSSTPSSGDEEDSQLLAAHHSIRLLATSVASAVEQNSTAYSKPKDVASFTGHASSLIALEWLPAESGSGAPIHFISAAQDDRFVSVWRVPSSFGAEGTQVASLALDSDVRQVVVSRSDATIGVVSTAGDIRIVSVVVGDDTSAVKQLSGGTNVLVGANSPPIIALGFVPNKGDAKVVRLAGGVKPVFDTITYVNDDGDFVPEVKLKGGLATAGVTAVSRGDDGIIPTKRYTEAAGLAIRSGHEFATGTAGDADVPNSGELDADLAELSLGQRLATTTTALSLAPSNTATKANPTKNTPTTRGPIAADSLSLTLSQALHSSDAQLLEQCLSHTNNTLVLSTVKNLPPALIEPLLKALVERLNRGHRGVKGGGGGASAQRGEALVRWVKAIVIIHAGFLMTIPDLVSRLSTLHTTLTSRLALQDRLIALNGRLDLVLSQIEFRSSGEPASIGPDANAGVIRTTKKKAKKTAAKYVEGESSEDEVVGMDVDDDDEGSVEDVELGGSSGEEDEAVSSEDAQSVSGEESDEGSLMPENSDDEESEEDSEDDSEDEGETGRKVNGLMDMEAEDTWGEDESEESDE